MMKNYLIGIFNINKVMTYYNVPNQNSMDDAINSLKEYLKNDMKYKFNNEEKLNKEMDNMFCPNNFIIKLLNPSEIHKI